MFCCSLTAADMSCPSLSSYRHDVAEVAGLTSFSFGEDEESRYVMLFKKVLLLLFFFFFLDSMFSL